MANGKGIKGNLLREGASYSVTSYSRLSKQFWNPSGAYHKKDNTPVYPLSKKAAKPTAEKKVTKKRRSRKLKIKDGQDQKVTCGICGVELLKSKLYKHKKQKHPSAIGLGKQSSHKSKAPKGVMTSMAAELSRVGAVDVQKAQRATQKFQGNKVAGDQIPKKRSKQSTSNSFVECPVCGQNIKKNKLDIHLFNLHQDKAKKKGRKSSNAKQKNKTRGVVPGTKRADPLAQEIKLKKQGLSLNGKELSSSKSDGNSRPIKLSRNVLSKEEAIKQREALRESEAVKDPEIKNIVDRSPYHDEEIGKMGKPQDRNRWGALGSKGHGSVSVGYKKKK